MKNKIKNFIKVYKPLIIQNTHHSIIKDVEDPWNRDYPHPRPSLSKISDFTNQKGSSLTGSDESSLYNHITSSNNPTSIALYSVNSSSKSA